MVNRNVSLIDVLNLNLNINIVDLGASFIEGEGDSIYKDLLASGNATVTGFEPNLEALEELNKKKSAKEKYLPFAVGDGKQHTLNLCHAWGMTSILEPNTELFNYFHGFSKWGEVNKKIVLETKRLDDIEEIEDIDFFKLDIQGAELMALQNSENKLKDCLVIHTEVEFLPLYKNQPLFSDVDLFLREKGFVLHNFHTMCRRMVSPLSLPNEPFAGLNQVLWADAVFIKDFTKPELLSRDKLLKYCVILHDIYSSFDIVLRMLFYIDKNNNTNFSEQYTNFLNRK